MGGATVINLAGSAVNLPEAQEWFARTLRDEGRALHERRTTSSNEFGLAELKERVAPPIRFRGAVRLC